MRSELMLDEIMDNYILLLC